MLRYLGVILSTLVSISSLAASLNVSELTAGKTQSIKVLDDQGKDVTSQYSIQVPEGIQLVVMSGKPSFLPVTAGSYQISVVPLEAAPEIGPFPVVVNPGAAVKLIIEDGNNQLGTVGQDLPNPLKVKAVDAYNNGVSGISVNWSLPYANGKDGVLVSPVSITDSDGIASSVYKMGSVIGNQQVKAEGPSTLKKGRSVTFSNKAQEASIADAKSLQISLAQSSGSINTPFSVSINVLDGLNNPFSGEKSVTVKAYKNNLCSTLSDSQLRGTTQATVSNGTVTLSDLVLEKSGDFYIGVESEGLKMACSSLFSVGTTTANEFEIQFVSKPVSVDKGVLFNPSVQVSLIKPNGYAYTNIVSATLAAFSDSSCSIPTSNPISGNTTRSSSLGKVYFSGNAFPDSGDIYIQVSSGMVKSSCEKVSIIGDANGPQGLSFSTFSSSGKVGKPLSVQPKVNLLNSKGYKLTEGSFEIKLSAFSDSSCSISAEGILTASNVSSNKGVATFSGLTYSKNGTIYLKAELTDPTFSSISACSKGVAFTGEPEITPDPVDPPVDPIPSNETHPDAIWVRDFSEVDERDEFYGTSRVGNFLSVVAGTSSSISYRHPYVPGFVPGREYKVRIHVASNTITSSGSQAGHHMSVLGQGVGFDSDVRAEDWQAGQIITMKGTVSPSYSRYGDFQIFFALPSESGWDYTGELKISKIEIILLPKLVGTWRMDEGNGKSTVVTFNKDGRYILESFGTADGSGQPGIEEGTFYHHVHNDTYGFYAYPDKDENGEWGFSHSEAAIGSGAKMVLVDGKWEYWEHDSRKAIFELYNIESPYELAWERDFSEPDEEDVFGDGAQRVDNYLSITQTWSNLKYSHLVTGLIPNRDYEVRIHVLDNSLYNIYTSTASDVKLGNEVVGIPSDVQRFNEGTHPDWSKGRIVSIPGYLTARGTDLNLSLNIRIPEYSGELKISKIELRLLPTIVGKWKLEESDGSYSIIEFDVESNPYNWKGNFGLEAFSPEHVSLGIETGSYGWIPQTGVFSAMGSEDSNGNKGFLNEGGWNGAFIVKHISDEKLEVYKDGVYIGDAIPYEEEQEELLSIVGVWRLDEGGGDSTILEFKSDGTYRLVSEGIPDEDGWPGEESGSYTWNNLNGAVSATAISDGNGDWGIAGTSGLVFKNINHEKLELHQNGIHLADFLPYEWLVQLPTIIGDWRFIHDDGFVTISFREDGTYTQYEEGEEDHPYYFNGSESGTYVWNEFTGEMNPTVISDNNGEWGFSHPEGTYYFRPQSDGNTMFLIIDGEHVVTFVRYVPEPEPEPEPEPVLFSLTTIVNGAGKIIISNPVAKECLSGSCMNNVEEGTSLLMTAIPSSGYSFDGWSGACSGTSSCSLVMNGSKTVTASFSILPPMEDNSRVSDTSNIYNITMLEDDKMILIGNFTTYNGMEAKGIVKVNSDLSIDDSFDPSSITSDSDFDTFVSILGKQDQKFIAILRYKYKFDAQLIYRIVRLNEDFSIDNTFTVGYFRSYSIAKLQPDGKILVSGNVEYGTDATNVSISKSLLRLNSNGTVDSSFDIGSGLKLGSEINSSARDFAFHSDGKIVLVGNFTSYNGNPVNRIVRINSDGSIDSSFVTGTGFDEYTEKVAVQSDGKVVVVGTFSQYNGTPRIRIARLNTDGTLDTTFGQGTFYDHQHRNIKIAADGKIYLTLVRNILSNSRPTIVRLNSNGVQDPTFYNKIIIQGGGNQMNQISGYPILDMAIREDGRVVAVGGFRVYWIEGDYSTISSTVVGGIVVIDHDGSVYDY